MENNRMDKIDKTKQKYVNNPIISLTGMESIRASSLFFLTKSILLTRHSHFLWTNQPIDCKGNSFAVTTAVIKFVENFASPVFMKSVTSQVA